MSQPENHYLEKRLAKVEESLDARINNTKDEVKASDGALTSKGKYISTAEWHATALGISPIGLGFLLPTPLGEFFIIAELMMLRTGFNKKMRGEKISGHLGDVMDEMAYTFMASLITTIILTYYGIGSVTTIDMSQVLLALLGGA